MTLHPEKPIKTAVIADALRDVVADQSGARRYRAVDDLLSRNAPRLSGQGPILATDDLVAGTVGAVRRMDETVLPVQGPPGTGKTYVTARTILALVRDGYRVGVASNSHEAIRNVLMGCVEACSDKSAAVPDIIHKISGEDDGYPATCPVRRTDDNADAAANGDIVGGTAVFFARPENIQAYDWLLVDEAGQVGLANKTAMGRAARNIVLVGDPPPAAAGHPGLAPRAGKPFLPRVDTRRACNHSTRPWHLSRRHAAHASCRQQVHFGACLRGAARQSP